MFKIAHQLHTIVDQENPCSFILLFFKMINKKYRINQKCNIVNLFHIFQCTAFVKTDLPLLLQLLKSPLVREITLHYFRKHLEDIIHII